MDDRTKNVHEWMKGLPDNDKMRFAINWRIPHSVFNTACAIRGGHETLQGIDWFAIYTSGDMGTWSHGGQVYVTAMS